MSLIDNFTASISVLNSNRYLSKSVCNLTNPSETTCLRQSKEFFKSLYMLSSPLLAEAAMTLSVSDELEPRFDFFRFLWPIKGDFMNYFFMAQSFSNQVLILLKKIWRRNPNFAGPSTETCARHDGHPQSPSSYRWRLVKFAK